MPILDANGQPLPASEEGVVVDQVDALVDLFDKNGEWGKLEEAFHEQLKVARLHAATFVQISLGMGSLDLTSEVGKGLQRLLAGIAIKAVTLKAREDRVEGKVIPMHKEEGDAAGT